MIFGVASGYFNPLHLGHIEYLNASKENCDFLCVIINSDFQRKLKGSKFFMDQNHRLKIVKSLKSVDNALISIDKDKSVALTLKLLSDSFKDCVDKIVFFNSGDRNPSNLNQKEEETCNSLGIEQKFLDLPKIYSSSQMISANGN